MWEFEVHWSSIICPRDNGMQSSHQSNKDMEVDSTGKWGSNSRSKDTDRDSDQKRGPEAKLHAGNAAKTQTSSLHVASKQRSSPHCSSDFNSDGVLTVQSDMFRRLQQALSKCTKHLRSSHSENRTVRMRSRLLKKLTTTAGHSCSMT